MSRATPADAAVRRADIERKRRLGPNQRLILSVITGVDPTNEQITFEGSGLQTFRGTVVHPYLGVNSWLRVMPEAGTSGFSAERGDAPIQTFVSYAREGMAKPRQEATERQEDVYRSLQEGSIEVMSSGRAYLCATERGVLELKGGAIHAHLNPDLQEFRVRAPTHRIECLGFEYAGNINNIRFGVVKRIPRIALTGPRTERPVKVSHGGLDVHAKEYSMILHSKGTPRLLVDTRIGHVIENDGTEPTLGDTSEKLRYRTILGTLTDTDKVRFEVDVKGNTRVQLPRSSTEGMILDILDGKLKVQANREVKVITRDKLTLTSAAESKFKSDAKIVFDGPTVEVGTSAVQSAAIGEQVVTIFTSLITALQAGPFMSGPVSNPVILTALNALRPLLNAINSAQLKITR